MDLVLNNLQWLISHRTKPNQTSSRCVSRYRAHLQFRPLFLTNSFYSELPVLQENSKCLGISCIFVFLSCILLSPMLIQSCKDAWLKSTVDQMVC